MPLFRMHALAIVVATSLVGASVSSAEAETAVSSAAFVDTIGLNVHLHYTNTAYYTQFPAVEKLLQELGIHHIREGAIDTKLQPFYDHIVELGRIGIKTTFIFNERSTPDFIRTFPTRVPGAFEAYEAPNEFNASKDLNWDGTLRSFQQLLYSTVKLDPTTKAYSVIGPSLTKREADVQLGDVSANMDFGNLHNYFGAQNPGTIGQGNLGYGSIAYNKHWASYQAGSRPLISTETGYCDLAVGNCNPRVVNGIYEPRLFLEQYLLGIVRTFQYELIDEGSNPATNISSNFGLLTTDLAPKPSFNALKAMNGLLSDSGPAYKPSPLGLTISGGTSNVRHVLFGKRDGTYVLALWLEVPSYDAKTATQLTVTPRPVSVSLQDGARSGTVYTYDAEGKLHGRPITIDGTGMSLRVDDHVTFVRLEVAR